MGAGSVASELWPSSLPASPASRPVSHRSLSKHLALWLPLLWVCGEVSVFLTASRVCVGVGGCVHAHARVIICLCLCTHVSLQGACECVCIQAGLLG